jgi:hypothetical protein
MRCNPVFSRCASCAEIPDAIGWTSRWQFRGSIVVECKTSHSDFVADRKKAVCYRHPEHHFTVSARRLSKKRALAEGYIEESVERMGDFRFFMCESAHIISIPDIAKHAPDHGLVYVDGIRTRVAVPAPRREKVDQDSEIRYLRFAIINRKPSQ